MSETKHHIYDFPDCKCLVVCGDIHGDFNILVNKVCVQYGMKDTVIIVAGDCGFGFVKKGYYETIAKRNSQRMNAANKWILFVRGNHDNPAYFDGHTFVHKRFMAIPDYSVVKANGHSVLCVGGAVSIDRTFRKKLWEKKLNSILRFGHASENDAFAPNYYWQNEAPVFNPELLKQALTENVIDTVVTHTAPSFCELQCKNGLEQWAVEDLELLSDVQQERNTIDELYNNLDKSPVTHWCYGHFHQSWHSSINGALFKMLDIMELFEIR